MRRTTSRCGDQPDLLSIQFLFRSRRMRISDMASSSTIFLARPTATDQVVTPRLLERMNVNRWRTSGICSTWSSAISKALVNVSLD